MALIDCILEYTGLKKEKTIISNQGILTTGRWKPSKPFLNRLQVAYRKSFLNFVSETSDIWSDNSFIALRKSIHDALMNERDDLAELLANPKKTNLYYGVDNLALNISYNQEIADLEKHAALVEFQRLSVALGMFRMWNPFGGSFSPHGKPQEKLQDADLVVSKLPSAYDFPAPFPGELAITTCRGPASYRAIQAIYQAQRVADIARMINGSRCLEIGAGMGRTAYYAHRLGFKDYTIIDLPTALVGQACFLVATLGEDAVSLPGENQSAPIKLRTPNWLDSKPGYFDIILNADSLTEMSESYAKKYVEFIRNNCRAFLSINHEANYFTARDLIGDLFVSRHPYPMREGYVEELAIMQYSREKL